MFYWVKIIWLSMQVSVLEYPEQYFDQFNLSNGSTRIILKHLPYFDYQVVEQEAPRWESTEKDDWITFSRWTIPDDGKRHNIGSYWIIQLFSELEELMESHGLCTCEYQEPFALLANEIKKNRKILLKVHSIETAIWVERDGEKVYLWREQVRAVSDQKLP